MSKFINRLASASISRRDFLKGSAVATAAVAGLSLAGCQSNTVSETTEAATTTAADTTAAQTSSAADVTTEAEVGTEHTPLVDIEAEGTWLPASCWHNCGGKCLVKALVKDGVVLRQKTDDLKEDTDDNPQQRACLRGRAQQQQALGADRIKYPMKRKNWAPGGGDNVNGDLRGKDEWEQISWDEALDMITEEIRRISDTYGTKSVLCTGSHGGSVMAKLGEYTGWWGTASFGTWWAIPGVLGIGDCCIDVRNLNDRLDLRKVDTVIAFGINPAWSSLGNALNFYRQAKDNGAEFIIIDPIYTDTVSSLGAKWVPIRPATDMAMLLAIAYTMIEEDDPDKNPLIDWDFLDRCCYGFDAEHMPPDARTEENFKDYVLGAYDDTPKTPEWASEICGVDPDTIREIARKLGKDNKVALLTSWSTARAYNSDSLPQLFITVGAMGGHFGKSGHMTGVSCWNYAANLGPALVTAGASNLPPSDRQTYPATNINGTELWNAVLNGKFKANQMLQYTLYVYSQWETFFPEEVRTTPAPEAECDIHMIWHDAAATLQTLDNMSAGIEAHRKMDFVLSQSHFMTTNSRYSDIVLPVTTMWERSPSFTGGVNRDILLVADQIIEPQFEAKDDSWICDEICKRFDVYDEPAFGPEQQFFNQMAGCQVIAENGKDFEPLVTITAEDIKELGVEGEPQEGRISYKQFMSDGLYQVERHEGDNYGFIAYEDFRKDPEANPLCSHTGKIEIYSQSYSDLITNHGYNYLPPIPKYTPFTCGYETTFKDNDIHGEKGEYPFQAINSHYLRRSHSILDNLPWLREACPNPVFISQTDADAKKIEDGDTVLVSSAYGKTLRKACVTERIMPGVVSLPHGAWVDMDEETGIDQAGADNYLTGGTPTGIGVSGWNTQNVNIEKYDGKAIPDDVDVPQRIYF